MDVHEPAPSRKSGSILSLSLHRLKKTPRALHRAIATRKSVFKLGRNVQSLSHADRVSFLIDADRFFRCFAEALARAENQILILGWDIDTRTELPLPDDSQFKFRFPEVWKIRGTVPLGEFVQFLVDHKPDLCVSVLSWDFSFIYLLEREAFPSLRFSTLNKRSPRVRYVLDKEHPALASHHQKIVVVDDRVAFSGGLDLTQRRWDTPEHKAGDLRRVDPGGHLYGPFHDVQMCVEGETAAHLGALARQRWLSATGEHLKRPERVVKSAWPPSARVDLENVEVGLSRTEPLHKGKPVFEVERLFLDSIRTAKRFIYFENQYFTSPLIAKAIAKRLREADGPEVVLVLPRDQTGWIEEGTMGLLRSQALRLLEQADHFDRFRCFYPIVPAIGDDYVKVHSKVTIIDDQFVRIGSANMNSRSMGLDTECDLAIEAKGRPDVVASIARLRRELLGEHLDIEPAEFDARFLLNGSLVDTVDSFVGRERTLVPLEPHVPDWVANVAPPRQWIDPSAPHGIRRWFFKKLRSPKLQAVLALAVVALAIRLVPGFFQALDASWSWLRSWSPEKIAAWIESFRQEPWAIPAVLLSMVAGCFLFVPITAMFVGLAFVFPPVVALCVSLTGGVLAAQILYWVGQYWSYSRSQFLHRPLVQKISRQIMRQMSRGGLAAVTAIRMTPIAPFAVVSVVAGGLGLRLRDYLLGSALGLLPGALAIALISQGAISANSSGSVAKLISLLILAAAVVAVLPRLFLKWRTRRAS